MKMKEKKSDGNAVKMEPHAVDSLIVPDSTGVASSSSSSSFQVDIAINERILMQRLQLTDQLPGGVLLASVSFAENAPIQDAHPQTH